MNTFLFLLQLVLGTIGIGLALLVSYQMLLAVAAWFAPRVTPRTAPTPATRFVVLIPAHNEETLLPTLLTSLNTLDYPSLLYTIHVVADNCQDQTAAVAQEAGAVVHERVNPVATGKGHALQWLLAKVMQSNVIFDAAVIVDADSVVAPTFLTIMDSLLVGGADAIQAHYAVRNPERSWVMRLRAAALTLVHYARPLGRMVIGGSVGLKGNGMVFRRSILAQHQWSSSVTEDIEYHMSLVLAGKRVVFATDAMLWAEMPGTLQNAYSQNVRWEQGRFQLAKQYVPSLLQSTFAHLQQRRWRAAVICLDSIMEHLIPPFAVLLGVTLLYLGITILLLPSTALLGIAAFLLLGQLLYLLLGLWLARTPLRTYLALAYVPIFLAWKLWLYGRMLIENLLGQEGPGWVRTARDEV